MEYHPFFIIIVIINIIFGIIFSFFNNNIFKDSSNSNNLNKINKKSIPIAYATDNGYVYPTLVSMTSLLENVKNETFYEIYILINPELTEENKQLLKTIEIKYENNCEIIFIDMGDKFKGEKTNQKIPTAAYYRLELHNLLSNKNRAIWLDGDTLVFEDLQELIKIDMKGNYIMGFLDNRINALKKFGINNATVLCSGVLLLDLNLLRKNKISKKFEDFMIKERKKIDQHDQTIINVVCQGKLGVLPPKYGVWNFYVKKIALRHNNKQRPHLKYNEDEFIKSFFHPAIMHFVYKPFNKYSFFKEWSDYAKRTGYFDECSSIIACCVYCIAMVCIP